MLKLRALTISGFKSYGPEETRLELSNLGPTLVIGRNGDESSNGSGKSSTVDAILWCLFGKTPISDRPADNVIGWGLEECFVRLETEDGYVIERKRKKNLGELLITKDGVDITHSTNINAQTTLNKIFDLDYELFVAGTFFGQFSKPFLELPDNKRRKALERLLHLHRLNARAEVAAEKIKEVEQIQSANIREKERLAVEVQRIKSDITEAEESAKTFEENRQRELVGLLAELKPNEERLAKEVKLDVVELKRKWEVVAKIEERVDAVRMEVDDLSLTKLVDVRSKIDSRNRMIEEWKKKSGGVCPKCLQQIDAKHAQKHVNEILVEILPLQEAEKALSDRIAGLRTTVSATEKKLEAVKPKTTVREAEAINRTIDDLARHNAQRKATIAAKRAAENPYLTIGDTLQGRLTETEKKLREQEQKTGKADLVIRHLDYLRQMYHDKNKLKSLILTDLVPYLNARLSYYLEAMGLDVKLEFNQFLQCKSEKWDYIWFSGGERKRIDVALMFALYDLHSAIYGKQCNVLVLDEIDGRLDAKGVQAFVEVIWKDFVNGDDLTDRPDSLLVISHKSEMFDAFPTKIIIERAVGGRSTLRVEGR